MTTQPNLTNLINANGTGNITFSFGDDDNTTGESIIEITPELALEMILEGATALFLQDVKGNNKKPKTVSNRELRTIEGVKIVNDYVSAKGNQGLLSKADYHKNYIQYCDDNNVLSDIRYASATFYKKITDILIEAKTLPNTDQIARIPAPIEKDIQSQELVAEKPSKNILAEIILPDEVPKTTTTGIFNKPSKVEIVEEVKVVKTKDIFSKDITTTTLKPIESSDDDNPMPVRNTQNIFTIKGTDKDEPQVPDFEEELKGLEGIERETKKCDLETEWYDSVGI